MNKRQLKALKAAGWKIGTVQELLDLSDEQVEFIEMKIALAQALKKKREKLRCSQTQLAARMGSSQARVAKIEKGEATLDILVRALLALGASTKDIARNLAPDAKRKAVASRRSA